MELKEKFEEAIDESIVLCTLTITEEDCLIESCVQICQDYSRQDKIEMLEKEASEFRKLSKISSHPEYAMGLEYAAATLFVIVNKLKSEGK